MVGLRITWFLIVGALLAVAPAWAQLTVQPQALSVEVPQHETATRTVTLTNTSDAPLTFCVTVDRPLQRLRGELRLAGGQGPCGEYGEVLYYLGEDDVEEAGWNPYGLTMTPDGRLFAVSSSGLHRTFELTPTLQLLRSFEHPHVAELTPFAATGGIGFDTESGTLWWMNRERTSVNGQLVMRRVLLLEGDLDGEPTGRRIEVTPPDAPIDTFDPGGVAYDPATDRFYFSAILGDRQDPKNWKLWVVDREGNVPEGYPVLPEPDGVIGIPHAHGGAEGGPEGVRIEYGLYPPFGPNRDRIVVVDRWGMNEGEALETPVPEALFEAGGAGINGNPLRSRVDPNGVMYMTFRNFDTRGIVGVRPHPLPPSWLVVDSDAGAEAAWDGTLAPGDSREVRLTFRAGAREVGGYTSALQVFDALTGEAVIVPLSLTVTQGTDAEDEPAAPASSSLTVYPNPTSGQAVVSLELDAPMYARVVVYDVLGREVAVLHDGRLAVGVHRLAFNSADLPSGVYVVRVESDDATMSRRLTLTQ